MNARGFVVDSRRVASVIPFECDRPYCHGALHSLHVVGSCAECDSAREFLAYLGSDLTDLILTDFLAGFPLGFIGVSMPEVIAAMNSFRYRPGAMIERLLK